MISVDNKPTKSICLKFLCYLKCIFCCCREGLDNKVINKGEINFSSNENEKKDGSKNLATEYKENIASLDKTKISKKDLIKGYLDMSHNENEKKVGSKNLESVYKDNHIYNNKRKGGEIKTTKNLVIEKSDEIIGSLDNSKISNKSSKLESPDENYLSNNHLQEKNLKKKIKSKKLDIYTEEPLFSAPSHPPDLIETLKNTLKITTESNKLLKIEKKNAKKRLNKKRDEYYSKKIECEEKINTQEKEKEKLLNKFKSESEIFNSYKNIKIKIDEELTEKKKTFSTLENEYIFLKDQESDTIPIDLFVSHHKLLQKDDFLKRQLRLL